MRVVRREVSFPDDLEGRLDATLSLVNTPPKLVVFLHTDKRPVTKSQIRSRIRATIGEELNLPQTSTIRKHCQQSLAKYGLIAIETTTNDDQGVVRVEYCMTDSGRLYGVPVAAFTVNYIASQHMNLYRVLGKACSSGRTRAPSNRVRILEALENGPLRTIDVAERLSVDPPLAAKHLLSLRKNGLVDYDSAKASKGSGYVEYAWVDGNVPSDANAVATWETLTRRVAQRLYQRRRGTAVEIAKTLDYPNSRIVTTILRGLEDQGHAFRPRWRGKQLQSEAKLVQKGRQFLEDYIRPIKTALADTHHLSAMRNKYTNPKMSKPAVVNDKLKTLYRSVLSSNR